MNLYDCVTAWIVLTICLELLVFCCYVLVAVHGQSFYPPDTSEIDAAMLAKIEQILKSVGYNTDHFSSQP
jgi:hypothetical protein